MSNHCSKKERVLPQSKDDIIDKLLSQDMIRLYIDRLSSRPIEYHSQQSNIIPNNVTTVSNCLVSNIGK